MIQKCEAWYNKPLGIEGVLHNEENFIEMLYRRSSKAKESIALLSSFLLFGGGVILLKSGEVGISGEIDIKDTDVKSIDDHQYPDIILMPKSRDFRFWISNILQGRI